MSTIPTQIPALPIQPFVPAEVEPDYEARGRYARR